MSESCYDKSDLKCKARYDINAVLRSSGRYSGSTGLRSKARYVWSFNDVCDHSVRELMDSIIERELNNLINLEFETFKPNATDKIMKNPQLFFRQMSGGTGNELYNEWMEQLCNKLYAEEQLRGSMALYAAEQLRGTTSLYEIIYDKVYEMSDVVGEYIHEHMKEILDKLKISQ